MGKGKDVFCTVHEIVAELLAVNFVVEYWGGWLAASPEAQVRASGGRVCTPVGSSASPFSKAPSARWSSAAPLPPRATLCKFPQSTMVINVLSNGGPRQE